MEAENTTEKVRRYQAAVEAINLAANALDSEVMLFVSHHLDEIGDEFWLQHCQVAKPSAHEILDILVLQSHWSEEDENGFDVFDFTLPDEVTNYIICVEFNQAGKVGRISMES